MTTLEKEIQHRWNNEDYQTHILQRILKRIEDIEDRLDDKQNIC